MGQGLKVLTLDVGNTTIDACVYQEGKLEYIGKFRFEEIERLTGYWDKVFVSSVKPSINPAIEKLFSTAEFIASRDVPLETEGIDKEKVGIDRLLNLYGAKSFYGKDCIVVSCGTAFVLDLLVDGVFVGGFITLGLSNKLRCLHERAELLPFFELESMDISLGKDTKEAMVGGVVEEAKHFIRGLNRKVQFTYKRPFQVVITGGDGWVLKKLGIYDPILLHRSILHLKRLP